MNPGGPQEVITVLNSCEQVLYYWKKVVVHLGLIVAECIQLLQYSTHCTQFVVWYMDRALDCI